MTVRLHVLDVPWSRSDLWAWFNWQRGLDGTDPNYQISNPLVVPRWILTEKLAFGMRMLLFWRSLYRCQWHLGSDTRSTSINVGTQVWSCGLSNDAAFTAPSERQAFLDACSQAVATATGHFNLGRYNPPLPDGAVRFQAFCEFCSLYDTAAFQETYTAGTSDMVSANAREINEGTRTNDPTSVSYAPVKRINLLMDNSLGLWTVGLDQENEAFAILVEILLRGVSQWRTDGQLPDPLPLATVTAIRDAVCDSSQDHYTRIPAINVREFHRVVFYCDAGRLLALFENHVLRQQNDTKFRMLLEIMDACLERRQSRLSRSSALIARDHTDLLYPFV